MNVNNSYAPDFMSFVPRCPTSFHTAAEIASRLAAAGFQIQAETEPWNAAAGGHYLVRDGALLAWWVPEVVAPTSGFRILGCHTDSPGFKLKPTPNSYTSDGWQQLNMEVYGGPLWNSWLDRELGLAGRLVTTTGESYLTKTGPIMRIPQLAIHLDRQVNSEGLKLNPEKDLHPVWAIGGPDLDILEVLAHRAGLSTVSEIGGVEVYAYDTQSPALFGSEDEFLACGRQDNLASVYAGLRALLTIDSLANQPTDIVIFAAFDHEEIGSETGSGAAGPLLENILRSTAEALGIGSDGYRRMLAHSSCVSSDVGHGVHPNYSDRHDPHTRPLLGAGPLLKINAQQRYATDAVGQALWGRALEAAGVKGQSFVSHNSLPCGSTIGPAIATRLGITTVDVGLAILSMHSVREMSAMADHEALSRVIRAYWSGA